MAKKKVKRSVKSAKAKTTKPFAESQTPKTSKQLTGSFRLMAKSLKLLQQHWRLFLVITIIYGVLSIILVRGIGGGLDLSSLKESLKNGVEGQYSQLATGTILFSYLIGSSGSSANPDAGTYQTLLVVLMSLVVIWALRQVLAGQAIKARDAFYKGTYPLVQFILILLVISVQLLPLLIGAWIYAAVIGNGLASSGPEKLLWLVIFFALAVASFYMVSSSIFAAYIVTLPDMTPLKALRSARALVRNRRWAVIRKVLFLPVAVFVIGAVIMIPLILVVTPAAEWIFFALSMCSLVIVHSYMYNLYRELL